MDSLIFELQIVFHFQLFLSANVRHIPPHFMPESRSRPIFYEIFCLIIEIDVM